MSALLTLALTPVVLGLSQPNNVGKLPALGWNSWNAYHCDIDETDFLSAASSMVSMGFKDAGYEYVNIDDCWSIQSGRNTTTNEIIPNPDKFPQGIKGTADKVHAMGLKIGIYSSAGTGTCAGYPASLGYEDIDAASFAAWGIDYLKYDNCGVPSNWSDTCSACVKTSDSSSYGPNGTCTDTSNQCPDGYDYSKSNTFKRYRRMRDALMSQNRTILYSLCEWGTAEVWTWGGEIGQSWRSTEDISPSWSAIIKILNENSFYNNYAGFYAHNDPDMLEVGNGNLTEQESRTHLAMWAIMKSPLIIGTDLSKLSQTNVEILQNKYLLAFNQDDQFEGPALPYKGGVNPLWTFNATNPAEYWAGPSKQGIMVAMMNTLDDTRTMRADFREIPGLQARGRYKVTNAWTGENMGCVRNGVDMQVETHDTAVLLVQDGCGGQMGHGTWGPGHGRGGGWGWSFGGGGWAAHGGGHW